MAKLSPSACSGSCSSSCGSDKLTKLKAGDELEAKTNDEIWDIPCHIGARFLVTHVEDTPAKTDKMISLEHKTQNGILGYLIPLSVLQAHSAYFEVVCGSQTSCCGSGEPKNNDGRSSCYWCGSPTKEVELGMISSKKGNVCTKCGK